MTVTVPAYGQHFAGAVAVQVQVHTLTTKTATVAENNTPSISTRNPIQPVSAGRQRAMASS